MGRKWEENGKKMGQSTVINNNTKENTIRRMIKHNKHKREKRIKRQERVTKVPIISQILS
jgi:hypothetical protein